MAKLEMTLDEYGKSPAGKGNVTGSQYLAEAYKKKSLVNIQRQKEGY